MNATLSNLPDSGQKVATVVVADDHPLYRQGVSRLVQDDARFKLLGEAEQGTRALECIRSLKPDIAVLDISMPGMNGLEVAAAVHAEQLSTRLIMLTMLKDENVINKALALGVQGFVLKENATDEILNCLAAVAQGEAYVSPSLTGFLLRRRDRVDTLNERTPGLGDLTTAERRILKRIAEKKTTREIATELFVSPRTVETHRSNICTKLDLKGSNALLQFALEHRELLADLE